MSEPKPDKHFMDHPEVREVFASVADLLEESDRGAVLLCAEYVNDQLGDLFIKIAPPSFKKGDVKRLLEFPGALASFSARHTIATLSGLISFHLNESIRNLRVLRNKAAHGRATFALRAYGDQVRAIYRLGVGMPGYINDIANEFLISSTIGRMMEAEIDDEDGRRPVFKQPSEALDWMRSNVGALAPLNEKLPRLELGIGTAMICGLIIHHRDLHRASASRSK